MTSNHKLAIVAAVLLLALKGSDMSKPRGIRNNNAGNIRGSDRFTWLGESGRDDKNFVIFDTPENGIRALTKVIKNYGKLYGINTLDGIIKRYAPASENNTQAYIAHAERALGISRHVPLSEAHYRALVPVIIKHENGVQPYTEAQINDGFERA